MCLLIQALDKKYSVRSTEYNIERGRKLIHHIRNDDLPFFLAVTFPRHRTMDLLGACPTATSADRQKEPAERIRFFNHRLPDVDISTTYA